MIGYRIGLMALGGVTAATAAGLGLLTARQNVVGWRVALFGLVYVGGGALYLPVSLSGPGSRPDTRHTALWWSVPGLAAVFLGAPLEWLLLPALLPRGLMDQALGLGLIAAGWLLWAWTRWVLSQPDAEHRPATNRQCLNRRGPYRFVRHPDDTGLVFLALGIAQTFPASSPWWPFPCCSSRPWDIGSGWRKSNCL